MANEVFRVGTPGQSSFQLRRGESGLSVFDPMSVDPPLTEDEILQAFRQGNVVISRSVSEIEACGLQIIATPGADALPERLRAAHCEIVPGVDMDRPSFKQALRKLE
jgi:hypothetical protein